MKAFQPDEEFEVGPETPKKRRVQRGKRYIAPSADSVSKYQRWANVGNSSGDSPMRYTLPRVLRINPITNRNLARNLDAQFGEGLTPISSSFGQKLFSLSGSGDIVDTTMYKRARVSKAPVATTSSVNFEAAKRRISLSGREYIGTVTSKSSGAFSTTASLLRPTDTTLFSWLSGIAAKFEEFKFHKLCFVYEPQCPTSTSGSVGLWYDGDPTHCQPADWNAMINTGANVHGAPWAKHVFDVPRHLFSSRKSYYTRSEFGDANNQALATPDKQFVQPSDPLEYYPGLYGFASQDVGAALALGKVYLDYSVSFQTQNVGNYNITSLASKSILSIETASNSGSGYIGTRTGLSTSIQATWVPVFGSGSLTTTGYDSGSVYFNTNSSQQRFARTALELLVTLSVNLSGSMTAGKLRIMIVDGETGVQQLIDTDGNGAAGAATTKYLSVSQYPSDVRTAAAIISSFQVKLRKNDEFTVQVYNTGAVNLSGYSVVMTPCVFGLTA